MKIGVFHQVDWWLGQSPKEIFDAVLERCRCVEGLGYESFWIAEHHFPSQGTILTAPSFVAALAARTKRIRIGLAVDVVPSPRPFCKVPIFGESLETAVWCSPSGESVPLWAAEQGLGLLCCASTTLDDVRLIQSALTFDGHQPRPGDLALLRAVVIAESDPAACHLTAVALGQSSVGDTWWAELDGPLVGSVETVATRLGAIEETIGDGRLLLNFSFGSLPPVTVTESLERFTVDLLPRFNPQSRLRPMSA